MSKILYGVGLFTYATVSMVAFLVKGNRDIAREEIFEIDSAVHNIQQNRDVDKFLHPENTNELLEQWRVEKVAEKRGWLQKPFYEQIWSPPIHSVLDLHYPLNK